MNAVVRMHSIGQEIKILSCITGARSAIQSFVSKCFFLSPGSYLLASPICESTSLYGGVLDSGSWYRSQAMVESSVSLPIQDTS